MHRTTIVTHEVPFQIQPTDIDISRRFWGAFGSVEKEDAAHLIVRYCQLREGWLPFNQAEIEAYAKRSVNAGRLLDPWVVQSADGNYQVTVDFIAHCFAASPATKKRDGLRVVVIEGANGEARANLGVVVGTSQVYFTLTGGGECVISPEDPTVRPPSDWVAEVGGDELHIDEKNPRIRLDNGGIRWGINCWWMPVSPQP